jgi:hypothetical protein
MALSANNRTLTVANSTITITVPNLFNSPQVLGGYMADRAWETDIVELAEVVMGVDGVLSGGFVPFPVPQVYYIMPTSLTSDMFETWIGTSQANQTTYPASGKITLLGTGKSYTMQTGYLTKGGVIPNAGKLLEGRPFTITWQSVLASAAMVGA